MVVMNLPSLLSVFSSYNNRNRTQKHALCYVNTRVSSRVTWNASFLVLPTHMHAFVIFLYPLTSTYTPSVATIPDF